MLESKTRVYYEVKAALADPDTAYIDNEGGARSGKTFSVIQILVEIAKSYNGLIISIVSETFPHLKRGAIRDFKQIMADEWDEVAWSKSESIYTFPSGSIIEFFSADNAGKVHGPGRDILFINEGNHLAWETARQLFIRTRLWKIVDYNPTHEFWMHKEVASRDGCVHVHSTYKDNPFLPAEQVREIEANKTDERWWKVYGKGELGTLEGLVYSFTSIRDLPDTSGMLETYGIDYGFTNSITAIVHCFIHRGRKEIYLDEIIYRKGMLNSDINDALLAAEVSRSVPIYADAAEPKSNEELSRYGWNVLKCDKTSESDRHNPITAQIGFISGYALFVTQRSLNLIDEMRNYVWNTNKDGERLNVPVKVHDHLMDAFRYGCYSPLAQEGNGQYTIGFRNKPIPRPAVQKKRYTTERAYAHKQRNHR